MELDGLTLTDSLTAYGAPADPLLPIGELTRLLELDVDVSPAERRIVGRLGESRRALLVDLASGAARDGPRTVQLGPGDVVVSPSEIYMRASAVQKLFPLKFDVDPEALSIKLTATELLPIQGRLERMAHRRDPSQDLQSRDQSLSVATPYRLFSWPAFDVNLGVGAGTTSPREPLRYDIRAGGDLLYSGFEGYLGSDERGQPATARLLFERRSLEGHLLGPLHARTVSVGDVFTPALSLGPRSLGGPGIAFSTVPLDQANVFNRIDLRGELPIGYDVELYVNDVLRSGQNTPTKGRYEFLNVPLTSGVNVVRIVTYGPHGERNEDVRVVNVGAGLLQRGEATFAFGAVQQDDSLISFPTPAGDTTTTTPGKGRMRIVGTANYGLTQFLTMSLGAALVPTTATASRQIYTLGARTSLFGFASNLDLAQDSRGGTAASLGLAGQVFGSSVVLRHAEYRGGFIDENGAGVDLTRPLSNRSEISLDSNVKLGGQVVPVSLHGLHDVYADGGSDYIASARGSATAVDILFSAGLEYARTNPVLGSSTQTLSGYFAGSTFRSYKWQLRSTIDFDILPDLKARSLAITADRDISKVASLRLGVGEALDDFKSFNLTASSTFKLRYGDLALTADYNNADRSWETGVQLNFGLSYDPSRGGYGVTRPGPGSGGSVLFEAFLDRNGNGIFDAGDEPVPNVTVEGGDKHAVTGKDGRVFITGLGAGPTARLLVGLENVENTSVQAPPGTIQFTPHAGSFTIIRYPMRPTGEIMVKVSLRRPDGALVGLSAVQVRMVGDKAQVVEAKTEFDGSANFQSLPAGTYHLELDPDQAARLRMSLVKPVTVTIKGDGEFLPDAEAEVKFQPRPEEKPQDSASLEVK
ncbi:hypothetical protein DJ021_17255 [Phenylobacterium hankyongense]|uniref:Fimbrial biogenesis outer membrane usher protein n=1 Tax=Phenylobacterium hankyongense TaxID=1813876 RepID=A0A328B4D2_9CAUL|nr:hypothetical protein [Phenylobacterium hankyongense]RAK61425.1 hypothetical protein DJ021_17255 [Phenylobacterium hankyongense]